MLGKTTPSLARPAGVTATALAMVAGLLVASPTTAQAAPVDASLLSRDYNGDGNTDVLTVDSAGRLSLHVGDGRGGSSGSSVIGSGWQGYTVVMPGDFNGDGRADILGIPPSGQLFLYAGTGNGGFSGKTQIGHGWQDMAEVFSPGDFNGDGKADIIATTPSGAMRIYYGDGTGRVGGSAQIGNGWQVYPDVFAGGDFNGDGRADLFARDGGGRLFAYYGHGDTRMNARAQIGQGWGGYSQLSSIGDFTGDGHTDLFTVENRSGKGYVYPSTGASTFAPRIVLGDGWQDSSALAPTGDFVYERTQLFTKLNDLRASKGLRPVARSAELDARAQAWAKHMAETQNMYHTPNFSAQMRAAGWSYKSELIVRNTGGLRMNVDDIVAFMHNWWVGSPGHYPWMISPNYTHVGHGYYMGPGGPYAVTVLGGR